ncbi:hypothetical protein AM571_PC00301 (plasmid) [Rhizobium etli 8C-3]|uniref:Uncharacterized protein n=1 Tax=Rhizobium etli 8C-3 TaxID=538025 RepID=A0A1L5PCW9_RHIET|nr:hypothetical protein AM571_PC00301 [Rhizobium etli 8C-3]
MNEERIPDRDRLRGPTTKAVKGYLSRLASPRQLQESSRSSAARSTMKGYGKCAIAIPADFLGSCGAGLDS